MATEQQLFIWPTHRRNMKHGQENNQINTMCNIPKGFVTYHRPSLQPLCSAHFSPMIISASAWCTWHRWHTHGGKSISPQRRNSECCWYCWIRKILLKHCSEATWLATIYTKLNSHWDLQCWWLYVIICSSIVNMQQINICSVFVMIMHCLKHHTDYFRF